MLWDHFFSESVKEPISLSSWALPVVTYLIPATLCLVLSTAMLHDSESCAMSLQADNVGT